MEYHVFLACIVAHQDEQPVELCFDESTYAHCTLDQGPSFDLGSVNCT
jgi:hypothetical protein